MVQDLNEKVLEGQSSANNSSNGNALTNLDTDMNTSQIIYRMKDRHEQNQEPTDFSLIQPSQMLNQIIPNPFLLINQNITTIIPAHLQNMFNHDAVPNAPNPLNVNPVNTPQNFSNNVHIFPQNQQPNFFSNDQTPNNPLSL